MSERARKVKKYQVRMRYAGSVLIEVKAENKAEAREKGLQKVQEMDSDTFLSALELQHLDTEVTCLCSNCGCELQGPQNHPCNVCKNK